MFVSPISDDLINSLTRLQNLDSHDSPSSVELSLDDEDEVEGGFLFLRLDDDDDDADGGSRSRNRRPGAGDDESADESEDMFEGDGVAEGTPDRGSEIAFTLLLSMVAILLIYWCYFFSAIFESRCF